MGCEFILSMVMGEWLDILNLPPIILLHPCCGLAFFMMIIQASPCFIIKTMISHQFPWLSHHFPRFSNDFSMIFRYAQTLRRRCSMCRSSGGICDTVPNWDVRSSVMPSSRTRAMPKSPGQGGDVKNSLRMGEFDVTDINSHAGQITEHNQWKKKLKILIIY